MDRAWLRDGKTIHTGEALMLACLLHTKYKRTRETEKEIAALLDDPNQKRPKKKR